MKMNLMDFADQFYESEKLILFSAIEKKGVFVKKCEIKLINKEGVILSDGEFLYPLGDLSNIKDFSGEFHSGVLGRVDNVRKVVNSQKIKKWVLMEKEFAKFESSENFEDLFLPKGISVEIVETLEQLDKFCHLRGKFLEEESGNIIDVNRLYESLEKTYPDIFPALISYEGKDVGIVNSNFSSQKGSMINMLFIEKEFRSRGYGKILLKWYIHQILKKTKKIYLFYSPENKPAMKIYKKLGFVNIDKWLMAI